MLFTNATDKLLCIAVYMPCDTGVGLCDVNIGLLKTSMMFSQRYLGLYTCMMNTR